MQRQRSGELEMFKLRFNARQCISCGICMDVCSRGALSMRAHILNTIEGSCLSYFGLQPGNTRELPSNVMMTFPYLAQPHLCDGCLECMEECPVTALELHQEGHHQMQIRQVDHNRASAM
jgi:ferredoxin